MKAGIWGVGFSAGVHVEALKAIGVEVAAAVGANAQRTEAFARRYGIPAYGTEDAILLNGDIDTVHVCTPPSLHYAMVKRLLEAGKAVLCEKPLCLEDAQAEELAALARAKGLACGVNFNVRYHLACQKARKLVADPAFGRVKLIHGSYLQEFNAFPAPLDWRYDPALAGRMRAVTEIGSHWADAAQYISGQKIIAVSALLGRFDPIRRLENGFMTADDAGEGERLAVASEDAAVVSLRFSGGAIGGMTLSEVSQGRVNRLSVEVTGENANLWWNSEDNNRLNTAHKGGGVNTEVFGFGNGFNDTFRELLKAYYAAVEAKAPQAKTFPGFEEGAGVVKLCNAVLTSSEQDSRWVAVDEGR